MKPMRRTYTAVLLSAFVLPGAGQIYNKERKKGYALVLLLGAVVFAFSIGLGLAMAQIMPPDATVLSKEETQALAQRILNERGGYLQAFFYLTMAIWIYGVVDAYLGAREREGVTPAP